MKPLALRNCKAGGLAMFVLKTPLNSRIPHPLFCWNYRNFIRNLWSVTVWNTLWNDETYRQWTAPFGEGSRAETDWKTGSKVLFLGNKDSGMVSTIADNKPNEHMFFQHNGIVNKGVEDLTSEEARQWATATEEYTLRTVGKGTELIIHMRGEIPQNFVDYFMDAWPKALEQLKAIAERN